MTYSCGIEFAFSFQFCVSNQFNKRGRDADESGSNCNQWTHVTFKMKPWFLWLFPQGADVTGDADCTETQGNECTLVCLEGEPRLCRLHPWGGVRNHVEKALSGLVWSWNWSCSGQGLTLETLLRGLPTCTIPWCCDFSSTPLCTWSHSTCFSDGFFYCRCWFFFGVLFVCFVVLFWFFSCQEEAAKYVLDFVSKDENMEVKPNRQTPRRQSLLTFFHRKLQGHRFTVGVRQMKRLQSHLLILSPPVRNVWHRCKCIAWDASGLLRTVNGRSACLPLILGSLLQKHHWTFIKTVFGYTESCFLPPCLPPVEAKYSKWENLQLTPCFGTSQLKVRLSLLQEPGSCSKSPSNPKCGCSEGGSLWERLTAMGNGELDVPLAPLQTCPVSCLEQHPQTCLRKKNICSSMSTRAPPKHRQIVLFMV